VLEPYKEVNVMRIACLAVGLLCLLFGAELLVVDKIVLHPPSPAAAERAGVSYEDSDEAGRVIDLPDSAGFVLLAAGAVCVTFFLALAKRKEH
jgi:hypothetical protein